MNTTGKREPVFAPALFGFVLVLRPLCHQALQARQVNQPARQRRSFEPFDVGGDVIAPRIERAEPGRRVGAVPTFVKNYVRQPISQYAPRERAGNAVTPVHLFGDREREFKQPTVGMRVA